MPKIFIQNRLVIKIAGLTLPSPNSYLPTLNRVLPAVQVHIRVVEKPPLPSSFIRPSTIGMMYRSSKTPLYFGKRKFNLLGNPFFNIAFKSDYRGLSDNA